MRILRDGQPITDTNNKVLPGELVSLTVQGTIDSGSTFTWNITGDYFKKFTPATPSVYEDASAVVKNQQAITYRYIKGEAGGAAKKISCKVTLSGASVDVEDELKVYQPVSTFSLRIGGDSVDSSGSVLTPALNDVGTYGAGMDWKGTTVTLPDYGTGHFGFVQTGVVSRTVYAGTTAYKLPDSGSQGLDFGFLYGGYEQECGVVVGSLSTNKAGDTPGDSFSHNVKNSSTDTASTSISGTRLVIVDSFVTWLMFKSTSIADSCWVPLRKQSWSWQSDARPTIPKSPPLNGAGGSGPESSDFPSWSAAINIYQPYIKVGP